MVNKLYLHSDVNNGYLEDRVYKELTKLTAFDGKRITLTLEPVKNPRSSQQNKYYWKVVIESQIACFEEMWGEIYTKDQVHDWNKANIFCSEKLGKDGNVYTLPGSSATKSTVEFERRIELIRQFFFNTFNWVIHQPNE